MPRLFAVTTAPGPTLWGPQVPPSAAQCGGCCVVCCRIPSRPWQMGMGLEEGEPQGAPPSSDGRALAAVHRVAGAGRLKSRGPVLRTAVFERRICCAERGGRGRARHTDGAAVRRGGLPADLMALPLRLSWALRTPGLSEPGACGTRSAGGRQKERAPCSISKPITSGMACLQSAAKADSPCKSPPPLPLHHFFTVPLSSLSLSLFLSLSLSLFVLMPGSCCMSADARCT